MGIDATQRTALLGALAACALLLVVAPGPATLVRTLRDPASADTPTAPLVALLTLVAWCLAAYLLGLAAVTAGTRLPGALGRGLGAARDRLAPAGLRRALDVALGVTLVVGSVAGPASAATAPVAPPAVTAVDERVPSLDHPLAAPSLDHPSPAPSLDHPVAAPPADHPAPAPSLDHPVTPTPSAPTAAPRTAPAAPAPADTDLPTTSGARVVVEPGDSLWSIAQGQLGPQASDAQVAQAWPSWWQANRELVGEDPDLLLPGTALTPPDAPPHGT